MGCYPAIIHDEKKYPSNLHTVGYILEASNDKALELFDRIEGYPELYNRKAVKCKDIQTGKSEDVIVYYVEDESKCTKLDVNDFKLAKIK